MKNGTSQRIVYFNDRFIPEAEARVSIFDSALMFGDMAFEVTRTYKHQPFKLREHLNRLYGSLRLLEIDCGLSVDEMERITLETLDRNLPTESDDTDWQIMHDVSRGPLEVYRTAFREPLRPTVSINCWPRSLRRTSSFPPSIFPSWMRSVRRHGDSPIQFAVVRNTYSASRPRRSSS